MTPSPRASTPAYVRVSPAHVEGEASRRLMVVLRTRGCEYARRTGGGCTVCGFLAHADEGIADGAILAQLDGVLGSAALEGVGEIDILTLGSFLNDREVSPDLRRAVLGRVSGHRIVRRISVESRAEYVTLEKLLSCKRAAGSGATLELGIGLESADEHVRNTLVRKGLPEAAFLEVASLVGRAGMSLLVYLLIKPPGLSEREAVEDAVASARYVFAAARRLGVRVLVAFEPVFVCGSTALEALYTAAEYRLVSLWSVIEVIRRIHGEGEVFVGLSDEGLSRRRMPGSCELCHDRLVAAIEGYNGTQDAAPLEDLHCACREAWARGLEGGDR